MGKLTYITYINTEEELLQWSIENQGYKTPYLMRVFDEFGSDEEMIFEVMAWLIHMQRTFPGYIKHKDLAVYIADVCVTLTNE